MDNTEKQTKAEQAEARYNDILAQLKARTEKTRQQMNLTSNTK